MKFWYLATPYTNYPRGQDAAYIEACRNHAKLLAAGVPTFCPIAHTHTASHYVPNSMRTDHQFWMDADRPFMAAAVGLIVVTMDGWTASRGVAEEIASFQAMHKPIFHMEPGIIPPGVLLRTQAERKAAGP